MEARLVLWLFVAFVVSVHGQRFKLDRYNSPLDDLIHSAGAAAKERSFTSFRLPNTSIPTQYTLELDTNVHLNQFSYSGRVQIQLTTLQQTKQIVVKHTHTNQVEVALVEYSIEVEREFLVIDTREALPANTNYRLLIEFTNVLRTDLTGFYRSSYQAEDGTTRYIAVTQFEASFARSAFPCYDEPWIRATFEISISCGQSYKATSNMPIAAIAIQPDQKKLTRFQVTPRMPTYLVAFMVTDFVSKRVILREPTHLTMEVYARASAKAELDLGLEKGAATIRALERYFDMTYDLPKLDQAAIPSFMFGAMENWGLVKYAERYLLYNDQTASNRDKEWIIATITHEFVHQFFGNLVTPKWWTDIFLNEGFATLYEYMISAEVEPSVRFEELIAVEAVQTAFYVDSKPLTRPLSHYVETDLMTVFDTIAYQKGGSVLRMMRHALGGSTFQKGLRRYLADNQHSAVDPNDLFESLQSAAEEDEVIPKDTTVGAIMSPWVYQSGYPVITVTHSPGSNEVVFRQQHFSDETPDSRTWWVPISYRLSSQTVRDETETRRWIPQGTAQISINLDVLSDEYLLVNPRQTGYYRVNYDGELWGKLIDRLMVDHEAIPAVSRSQLIDDSLKLALDGQIDIDVTFELFKYLKNEVDYIPWYTALASDNIQFINKALVVDEAAYGVFRAFMNSLTGHLIGGLLGFAEHTNEPHEHQHFRSMAIEWSCRMGDLICRAGAHQLMMADLDGSQVLPSYIKHSIYCGGLMDATEEEFVAVFNAYQQTTDSSQRSMYISALGCNENKKFLIDYLILVLGAGQEIRLNSGENLQIVRSVYYRSNVGHEAFQAWLEQYNESIMNSNFGRLADFHAILADVANRQSNFGNFEQLIALLNAWQAQTEGGMISK
ncbi:aminopeptidase N [Aedes albopictus]|uniref:Aminopeptidase n=1 Tax=Aedes albopictus TaxID=7160 RepID=A0ABM1Z0U6_AEDAL